VSREAAHYLHARPALEALLAVPTESPRCVSWVPAKEVLLVADARGVVMAVEPSFGSRKLFAGPPEPVHVSCYGEKVAVLAASGRLEVRTGGWEPELVLETELQGESGLRFWRGGVAVIGDTISGRVVKVYEGDTEVRSLAVSPGTALGVSTEGHLLLARSVAESMRIVPFGDELPDGEPTRHVLRFSTGGRVLGVVGGGATLWHEGQPYTARLLDTGCAALAADGRTVALGTWGGLVALADILGPAAARAHPPRVAAHEEAVRSMAFAHRGRWLATVGENCRLWSY